MLLVVGWAISLFVMGLVLRFGTGAEALAWGVMFVVLPLSGVFYPVDALPTVLQPIALALPTTHAFTALRGLVDGTGLDWAQLAIAAVGSVVMLAPRVLVPRARCSRCSAAAATSRATPDPTTRTRSPAILAGGPSPLRDGLRQAATARVGLHSRLSLYW